jgi:hypothetical protein
MLLSKQTADRNVVNFPVALSFMIDCVKIFRLSVKWRNSVSTFRRLRLIVQCQSKVKLHNRRHSLMLSVLEHHQDETGSVCAHVALKCTQYIHPLVISDQKPRILEQFKFYEAKIVIASKLCFFLNRLQTSAVYTNRKHSLVILTKSCSVRGI